MYGWTKNTNFSLQQAVVKFLVKKSAAWKKWKGYKWSIRMPTICGLKFPMKIFTNLEEYPILSLDSTLYLPLNYCHYFWINISNSQRSNDRLSDRLWKFTNCNYKCLFCFQTRSSDEINESLKEENYSQKVFLIPFASTPGAIKRIFFLTMFEICNQRMSVIKSMITNNHLHEIAHRGHVERQM